MQADHLSLALNPQPCTCLALLCCWTVSPASKALLLIITVLPSNSCLRLLRVWKLPFNQSLCLFSVLLLSCPFCALGPQTSVLSAVFLCLRGKLNGCIDWQSLVQLSPQLSLTASFRITTTVTAAATLPHAYTCGIHVYSLVYTGYYFQCCIYATFLPGA